MAASSTAAPTKPKGLLGQAAKAADDAAVKKQTGEVVAGPFEVGNIGSVSVVKRESGTTSHLYGVFTPIGGGRAQRMPLAAVSVLAEALAE